MNYLEVFLVALKLGFTSFGGPIAHLGFFHKEYVEKKKWISESAYVDLVALCQFLPGPASSQVGIAIGLSRAGVFGAILAWAGFTLPSAIILVLLGLGLTKIDLSSHQHWIHALKIVAVAVVAQAVYSMAKRLCPDKKRATIAVISMALVLLFNSLVIQIFILFASGIIGSLILKPHDDLPHDPIQSGSKTKGIIFLCFFFLLLITLPLLRSTTQLQEIKLFDSFYRAGSLVFGGGHVVLPLLQKEVGQSGWVTNDLFMAGYGLANAIPGPLFTFSAYLGAVSSLPPSSWLGASICLIATFLPSFLLVIGVLPIWEKLRAFQKIRQSMLGINAAVVGILVAAFYDPVWTSAIFSAKDFALQQSSIYCWSIGRFHH